VKLTNVPPRLVIATLFWIAALFWTILGFTQTQPAKPATRGELIRARTNWFYQQRAYPLKHIPGGARLKALEQLDHMLADEAQSVTASPGPSSEIAFDVASATISSTQWTLIGPEPTDTPYNVPVVAGRVTALAVDSTNSNVVYAGAADGGVWKTTDAGVHWAPLMDSQPSLAVGSIAIDPSNHSTIYVGTGEENFSGDTYFGAGILKSVNGGTSWTQIKGPFVGPFSSQDYFGGGARIGAIAVEPGNSSVILVAVEMFSSNPTGIYRTADGGTTWTSVLPGAHGTAVVFDPTKGNIAYAALGTPSGSAKNGVYKSVDGGKTWTKINGTGSNVLPTVTVGRIALSLAPSSPGTLYAGIQDTLTSNLLGFFKTIDGGANWVKRTGTPDYCSPACDYAQVIAVQPNNSNVVFVGGAYGGGTAIVYRSTDSGLHWTNVTQGADGFYLHADLHALAFSSDSSRLYLGSDGGVWSANTPTATPVPWMQLNNMLAITQFYFSPSINPKDITNSFGGTQDNGSQKYSGVRTWHEVVCGDGGWTAMDPVTPSNVYSVCQGEALIRKSTGAGVFGSWSDAVSGINLSDRKEFFPPLAIDPLHPVNLYLGTYRVYQTVNNAGHWTAISSDLTGGSGTLTTVAVAPTNSNTVYVGTSNSLVYVTTNALSGVGAIWNKRSTGLPPRFITQVVGDPHLSTTAYVVFSGFSGFVDSLGHVFRTTDSGTTWKNISSNLPNIPVNGIAIDPMLANTYYVATDVGVFQTRNGGASWSTLGTGLPRVTVLGLTLHNPSRTLRASTHGRSMWDIHVPIADLAVSITESPNPAPHGTNLTYTLSVTNNGPDTATNTVVSDATPVGTTFVGFTTSVGTCTAPAVGSTGTLSCKVGNPASGAKTTVTMTVKDTAAAGSTLTNVGMASSTTPDPNTKSNSMTIKTSVD
jgi:uncharacterized repeat protein (TIGR01451 family)